MKITNITHLVKNMKSESASFWHIKSSKLAKYSKSNMAQRMMWAVQTERQGYQSGSNAGAQNKWVQNGIWRTHVFGMRVENGDNDTPNHEGRVVMDGRHGRGVKSFFSQPLLRCALRSWSRPCDPRPGACERAGGGAKAREGGALMSHSTGGAAGGGARRHPPLAGWADWVAAALLPVDRWHRAGLTQWKVVRHSWTASFCFWAAGTHWLLMLLWRKAGGKMCLLKLQHCIFGHIFRFLLGQDRTNGSGKENWLNWTEKTQLSKYYLRAFLWNKCFSLFLSVFFNLCLI